MFLAMRVLLASLVVSLARAKDVLMFGARFGPTGTASSFATGMCEPAMLATLPTFESESQQREAVCKKYGKENFAFKEIKEAKETVCACVTCVEPQAPVCPPTGDWEPDKGKPDRCFKVVVMEAIVFSNYLCLWKPSCLNGSFAVVKLMLYAHIEYVGCKPTSRGLRCYYQQSIYFSTILDLHHL